MEVPSGFSASRINYLWPAQLYNGDHFQTNAFKTDTQVKFTFIVISWKTTVDFKIIGSKVLVFWFIQKLLSPENW